jgi:hypothetical protein
MDYEVENYNGLCGPVSWKKAKYHNTQEDSYELNKNRLALTRTCRQIYEETKSTHGKLSTFHVTKAWKLVNWTTPLGAGSVVLHETVHFDGAFPEVRVFLPRLKDIVSAFVFWGDGATVENVCLQLECDHRGYLAHQHERNTLTQNVAVWMEDLRQQVGAIKAGVTFTGGVRYQRELLFAIE